MSQTIKARITVLPDQVANICRPYHVRKFSLFGSVRRDDFRDDSGVDMLVEFESEARCGCFIMLSCGANWLL